MRCFKGLRGEGVNKPLPSPLDVFGGIVPRNVVVLVTCFTTRSYFGVSEPNLDIAE